MCDIHGLKTVLNFVLSVKASEIGLPDRRIKQVTMFKCTDKVNRSEYVQNRCALLFKALRRYNNNYSPNHEFGLWSVQSISDRSEQRRDMVEYGQHTRQPAAVGAQQKAGLEAREQQQQPMDEGSSGLPFEQYMESDRYFKDQEAKSPAWIAKDSAYIGYSDETDEYDDGSAVDHNVAELLAKSKALAHGENTMAKKRKVKRAGQAVQADKSENATFNGDDIQGKHLGQDRECADNPSSFVSVKIHRDAHIQEMGRLFKEGVKSVASVSTDCNILQIKKLNVKSSDKGNKNGKGSLTNGITSSKDTDAEGGGKLCNPVTKCVCKISCKLSRAKAHAKVLKNNKYRVNKNRRNTSQRPEISCKRGNLVIKLPKRKKQNQRTKPGKILGTVRYVKNEVEAHNHLTDFEKALCTPDVGISLKKYKSRFSSSKKTYSRRTQVSTVDTTKDTIQCNPDVYIDIAANPDTSLCNQFLPPSDASSTDQEQLTGFKTIEEFEFSKDTSSNTTKETLNRKEYFHNSHIPDGYLTLTIKNSISNVYSFDLDHYGKDLFRVPVKDELVGTPLGKKRKVPQQKDIVKLKVPKKISLQAEQSKTSGVKPQTIRDKQSPPDVVTRTLVPQSTPHSRDEFKETDEIAEDNWDLEDYEFQTPAVEAIDDPLTIRNSQVNDISEPIMIDCGECVQPEKTYTKQLQLKKDSANLCTPNKYVGRTIEEISAINSWAPHSNMSNPNVSHDMLNNNNDSDIEDMSEKLLAPCSTEQLDINKSANFIKNTTVKNAGLATGITPIASSDENIVTVYDLQKDPLVQRDKNEIYSSTGDKPSHFAVVGSTLSNGVITQTGFSSNGVTNQPQRTTSTPHSLTDHLTVITEINKTGMPAPLMALAEIASNELSTATQGKANEIHRQALAKILPSPIVSPVAKQAEENERNHTPSSSPTCPIVEALKKSNALRFSLDENGEVSHQETKGNNQPKKRDPSIVKDPLPAMYFSTDGIAERKRKKKYAFAKNFIDELSSDKTEQNASNVSNRTFNFSANVQCHNDKSVTPPLQNTKVRKMVDCRQQFRKDRYGHSTTMVSTAFNTKPTKSPVEDFNSQLLQNTAPFITPQNQLLIQQIEKLKSVGPFPCNNIRQYGPLLPHQPLLNTLPAFSNHTNIMLQSVPGFQTHPPTPFRGTNICNQFYGQETAAMPVTNASLHQTVPCSIQTSNTSSVEGISNPDHSLFSSKENKLSYATCSNTNGITTTSLGVPPANNYNCLNPGRTGFQTKVLPKVSPENLKIYKKQLAADKQLSTASVTEGCPMQLEPDNNLVRANLAVMSPSNEDTAPIVSQANIKAHMPGTEQLKSIQRTSRPKGKGKIMDVRKQNHITNIDALENSIDGTSNTVKVKSGLDLLSAAANFPDMFNMEENSEKIDAIMNEEYTSLDLSSSYIPVQHSVSPIDHKCPKESFPLPHTPPESVNDRDDVSDSINTSPTGSAHQRTLASFSRAELFEELLKRQSLTKCICGCSFLDSTMYMLHRASHNTDRPHMCAYCGKVGRSWIDFYAHMCDHSK